MKMKSHMSIWRDIDGLHFEGLITDDEFVQFDGFDTLLLRDSFRDGSSAADWLIGLECIFRRAEQQSLH